LEANAPQINRITRMKARGDDGLAFLTKSDLFGSDLEDLIKMKKVNKKAKKCVINY